MKFRILGPLEVEDNGKLVTPTGHTARALLTLLLLHSNEPIAGDRLVEEIWGERIPANPLKALQIQISRLRKNLGSERLETIGGGYSLVVAEGELDRDEAASLVDQGRDVLDSGDPEAAGQLFREALSLFRGRPLEEFADASFARAESAFLEELRLVAEEGRFDSALGAGRGARIVGDLESLAAVYPLRERLHEQLLLALYQAGRQADALEAYQRVRGRFIDDLGLEPGPALQSLERRILNQDPSLLPKRRSGQPQAEYETKTVWRRHATILASLGALVGLSLISFAVWAVSEAKPELTAASLVMLDPQTLAPGGVVRLGGTPSDLVIGRRAVFVARPAHGIVVVVDPRTRNGASLGAPVRRPTRLAAGPGGLWVLDSEGRRVALLGSSQVFTVPAARGRGPAAPLDGFAAAERSIWLAERNAELVFRLDPRSGHAHNVDNRGKDSFFDGDARRPIAVAGGSVWLGNPVSVYPSTERLGRMARMDAVAGKLSASIRLPAPPIAVAADERAVWVALDRGDDLWRIDPRDNVAVAAVRIPGGVIDIAIGEGSVWALGPGGDVTRIDPLTNAITAHAELGRGSLIAAGLGSVWVAAR